MNVQSDQVTENSASSAVPARSSHFKVMRDGEGPKLFACTKKDCPAAMGSGIDPSSFQSVEFSKVICTSERRSPDVLRNFHRRLPAWASEMLHVGVRAASSASVTCRSRADAARSLAVAERVAAAEAASRDSAAFRSDSAASSRAVRESFTERNAMIAAITVATKIPALIRIEAISMPRTLAGVRS